MKGFGKFKEVIKAAKLSIQKELPHTKKLLGRAVTSTTELGKHAGATLDRKCNQVIEATHKAATSEEAQEYYSITKEVVQKTSAAAIQGISVAAERTSSLFHNALSQENIQKAIDGSKEIVLDGKNLITLRKEDVEQENGISDEEKIKKAISKLQKKDKIGLAGDGMAVVGGAAAGAAASGTIAAAAGASTVLGSTTLGSLLGGTFVAATPVGWVIGSAAAAAAAGYGISRLVRSGSKQDQIRREIVKRLNKRLSSMEGKNINGEYLEELKSILPVAIEHNLVSESQADRMIQLINDGKLEPELALNRIKSMKISIKISQV